jgi:hypothetical protein
LVDIYSFMHPIPQDRRRHEPPRESRRPVGLVRHHRQEIDELQAVPPRSVFDGLSGLILDDWRDEIEFYATSGMDFVDQLDPFIRPALREVPLLD